MRPLREVELQQELVSDSEGRFNFTVDSDGAAEVKVEVVSNHPAGTKFKFKIEYTASDAPKVTISDS